MYYKDANAILIAFSLTSADSFGNLQKWIGDVDENATMPNCIKVIIGLKCDMID